MSMGTTPSLRHVIRSAMYDGVEGDGDGDGLNEIFFDTLFRFLVLCGIPKDHHFQR